MRRLGTPVVAAAAVAAALLAGAADNAKSTLSNRCGGATPIDTSAPLGHATPLGAVLWISVYPYQPGYPTKAVVMAKRAINEPITLRAWNCTSDRPLRFWYLGGLPFRHVPVTATALRRTGTLRATFGPPFPARGMRGGYLMFWRTGVWKIAAYRSGQRIAKAVVTSVRSGAPHRPLHLPHLRQGTRCPMSPSHVAHQGTDRQQTLTGRGPAYLMSVGSAPGGRISIGFSARDSLGWYGQKTPWVIDRSYDGPILVRGARIGRPGQVRFAYGYGDHRRELNWDTGADQGSPPDPDFRFLASATLFRAPGCYAFQIDGTSFSEIVVARVTR